eukprot:jgi/Mesvir1/16675/Mv15077-RA.1
MYSRRLRASAARTPTGGVSAHGSSTWGIVWCALVLASATVTALAAPAAISAPSAWDVGASPIQLVEPDGRGGFHVCAEGERLLAELREPVAVLGVVGPYHSGKSFLLNSLLNVSSAFQVGRSTAPQTKGLWLLPTSLTAPDRARVLLLDSEGFYGNATAEAYDAKIFALSLLLSSHMLYNTVKVVDQQQVNYLEILAQRTQLFNLRAHVRAHNRDVLRSQQVDAPHAHHPPFTPAAPSYSTLTGARGSSGESHAGDDRKGHADNINGAARERMGQAGGGESANSGGSAHMDPRASSALSASPHPGGSLDWDEELELQDKLLFPHLTWVVQDFVSELREEEREDATEWFWQFAAASNVMQEVAGEETRGGAGKGLQGADDDISLGRLFRSISLKTLFLPATDLASLRDMSAVPPTKWTAEYQKDLNELRAHVLANVGAKSSPAGSTIDGPALAALARFAVSAANEADHFPSLPSYWQSWRAQVVADAHKDALTSFRTVVGVALSSSEVLSTAGFDQLLAKAKGTALAVFHQLLLGLEPLYERHVAALEREMVTDVDNYRLLHRERVRSLIASTAEDIRGAAVASVELGLVLPQRRRDIVAFVENVTKGALADFDRRLEAHLRDHLAKESRGELARWIEAARDRLLVRNRDASDGIVLHARNSMVATYKARMGAVMAAGPQGGEALLGHHRATLAGAQREAEATVPEDKQWLVEEDDFKAGLAVASSKIATLWDEYQHHNAALVTKRCGDKAEHLARDFVSALRGIHPFPDDGEVIEKKAKEMRDSRLADFTKELQEFVREKMCEEQRVALLQRLTEAIGATLNENVERYMELNEAVFKVAERKLTRERQAASWTSSLTWNPWYVKRRARQLVAENFREKLQYSQGVAPSMQAKMTDKWLSEELTEIMKNTWIAFTGLMIGTATPLVTVLVMRRRMQGTGHHGMHISRYSSSY